MNPMYKPGNVNAVPPIVGPHQPRLEWLMWQAAQRGGETSPWFPSLLQRLLQGKPEGAWPLFRLHLCLFIYLDDVEWSNLVFFFPVVVSLLQVDEAQYPFSQKPPVFIKAKLYNYYYTDPAKDKWAPYLYLTHSHLYILHHFRVLNQNYILWELYHFFL